jgi:REP-associated tyrosine transposase
VSPAKVDKVAEYIATHEVHHQVVSFQDEYRKVVKSHGIEYDERYVWD